jgi:uncharacterized protein involved in exopolysaccharide biosynthesis
MSFQAMEEEGEREGPGLRDVLAAFYRRRITFVATCVVGTLAAAVLALALPARFQSTATILIEQQEVPSDMVRAAITSFADQRIQIISQRVMTSQNLLDIVSRYDLYADERQRLTREAIVDKMRADVSFRMISADVIDPRSGTPREATIAFAVSFTSPSPEQAARVANELTTLYLNENLSSRARLAEETSGFLKSESDRLSRRIAELEGKLARFKEKNGELLPELEQLNMQLLDRTEQELRLSEGQMASMKQQRVYLEAQLAQLKPNSAMFSDSGERIMSPDDRLKTLRSQLAGVRARYGPNHPDIERMEREIAGLEADGERADDSGDLASRLGSRRAALAAARERYSEAHPDVERLTAEVASLEAELAKPDTPPPVRRRTVVPDNPAYIQIKAQLAATASDEEALERQVAGLRAQRFEYERRIGKSPQVEAEYRELMRDYANSQSKYQEIRSKAMEAQVSQNLEADRKGEKFTLIEPPLSPQEPISPNRTAILLVGLLGSLVLGAGLVYLRESLDATVRGTRDVIDLLASQTLGVIPRILNRDDLRRARRRLQLSLGSTAVGLVLALVAVHVFVRPIGMLWTSGLRRMGL